MVYLVIPLLIQIVRFWMHVVFVVALDRFRIVAADHSLLATVIVNFIVKMNVVFVVETARFRTGIAIACVTILL